MKILKLFLLTLLLINLPNFLNSMEEDSQQTDDEDDKLDIAFLATLNKLDDFYNEETSSLNLSNKGVTKQLLEQENFKNSLVKIINSKKIKKLNLKKNGLTDIPDYLLKLWVDKKSSLNFIDISSKKTRALDLETGTKIIDFIKTLIEKIGDAVKSKADKEMKKITVAVNQIKLDSLNDNNFLELPIQINKKDIAKFSEDPNISKIKFGDFTIYVIPEECKAGWNVAGKVFAVLGYVMTVGLGVYELYTKFGPEASNSVDNPCNCTAINGTAGMFGGF